MAAYWADVRLFMQKAEAGASGHPVVLHVEPDLWGYIEQAATGNDAATVPGGRRLERRRRPRRPRPTRPTGFAKAFVQLRDLYAPHVLLAYHLSVWGTMFDLHASQTSDAKTDDAGGEGGGVLRVARRRLRPRVHRPRRPRLGVLRARGRRRRGGVVERVGLPAVRRGSSAGSRRRPASAMVVWQIPMGNTLMRATNDTWGHYADNRPEWFLDDATDGNLASWRDAGVVGAAVRRRGRRDDLRLRRGRGRDDEPGGLGHAHAGLAVRRRRRRLPPRPRRRVLRGGRAVADAGDIELRRRPSILRPPPPTSGRPLRDRRAAPSPSPSTASTTCR